LYGRYPHPGMGVENFVKGKGLKEHHSIEGYFRHFNSTFVLPP